jgi:hypothetical protein
MAGPAGAPSLRGGACGPESLAEARQRLTRRLAALPLPRLCPRGFVFVWARKQLISGRPQLITSHGSLLPKWQCCVLGIQLQDRPAAANSTLTLTCRPRCNHPLPAPAGAPAAVASQLYAWGYAYVENLTWVWKCANNAVLRAPAPYAASSHLTLLIFRREGEWDGGRRGVAGFARQGQVCQSQLRVAPWRDEPAPTPIPHQPTAALASDPLHPPPNCCTGCQAGAGTSSCATNAIPTSCLTAWCPPLVSVGLAVCASATFAALRPSHSPLRGPPHGPCRPRVAGAAGGLLNPGDAAAYRKGQLPGAVGGRVCGPRTPGLDARC